MSKRSFRTLAVAAVGLCLLAGSQSRAATPEVVERIYHVADLVVPVGPSAPPAPKGSLSASVEDCFRKAGLCDWGDETSDVNWQTQPGRMLLDLVTNTVEPDSWERHGGTGTVTYYPRNMSLAVTHNHDVHAQIEDLFGALRRAVAVQTVTEIRLIAMPEEEFEFVAREMKLRGRTKHPNGPVFLKPTQMRQFMARVQQSASASVMVAPKVTTLNGKEVAVSTLDADGTGVTMKLKSAVGDNGQRLRLGVEAKLVEEKEDGQGLRTTQLATRLVMRPGMTALIGGWRREREALMLAVTPRVITAE